MTVRFQVRMKTPAIAFLNPVQSRAILIREVGSEVTAILEERATIARAEAPVGVTGQLRAGIAARVVPGVSARVLVQGELTTGAEAPYARYVAEGTRPGYFPPWHEGSSLHLWAVRVLGDGRKAYLVARAIFRRGTVARFRFRAAFMIDRAAAQRRVQAAVDRAARLLGGR